MIGQLGVASASDRSVQDVASPQPNVRDTVLGWSEMLVLVRLYKKIVNRENVNEEKEFTCMGMVQPFSARDLKVKPEGQRAWKWWMLHTTEQVALKPGEEFILKGTKYKVMSDLPYFRNGYYEYELIETFE